MDFATRNTPPETDVLIEHAYEMKEFWEAYWATRDREDAIWARRKRHPEPLPGHITPPR